MDSLFSFNRVNAEPGAPEPPAEPAPSGMATSVARDAKAESWPNNWLDSHDEALARLYKVLHHAYGTVRLFSVSPDFVSQLDAEELSTALRKRFEEEGYVLSPQAHLTADQPGKGWTISDVNTQFEIRREEDTLNVYDTPLGGMLMPTFSAHRMTERALCVGNYRGPMQLGGVVPMALKGGRLEGVVRAQFVADRPADVDTAVERLQQRLLAQRDQLWTAGVLRLTAEGTTLSEKVSGLDAWRKTADFRTLYEFQYAGEDGEGLIARIPIHINSDYDENTVITGAVDEMVRWDREAAPTLTLTGVPGRVRRVDRLSILAFLPEGWQGNQIALTATIGGTSRERVFVSVREFLATFELAKEGDKNATAYLHGDPYVSGHLVFPNADFPDPMLLRGGEDIFQIRYGAQAFDGNAAVYLRVLS